MDVLPTPQHISLGRQQKDNVQLSHDYVFERPGLGISDVKEPFVAKVLASLCELGLFQKMRIWQLMSAALGFLYHPIIWVRQGATALSLGCSTSASK